MSPLCQTHIEPAELNQMEPFYPLHAYVCDNCFLVQVEEFVSPDDIFSDYAYLSSYSDSWVEHARQYVEMISERLGLASGSQVIEIASNDGYLLQHFVAKGVPCLGVEPAANVAEIARAKGIETEVCFLGEESGRRLATERRQGNLILGNNVLAHVPNIHDFVQGLKELLAEGGIITMEFPHLLKLMQLNQFDTIYHEHFSYLSLFVVEKIFASHDLTLYDVDELPTHGGSIRIYARPRRRRDQTGERGRQTTACQGIRSEARSPRNLCELRGASEGNQACAVGFPDSGEPRGEDGRWIRGAR